MTLNKNMFREYDIRGVYQVDINEDVAYTIGLGYGSYLQVMFKESECLVGRDNRLSSPSLSNALIKGITDSGCNVTDLGLVTTPMLYTARYINAIPGIMVTASHNPKEDNGFKFSYRYHANTKGQEIYDLRDFIEKGNFLSGHGTIKTLDVVDDYIRQLHNTTLMGNKKLKVVIDPANGTTSDFIHQIHDTYPNLDIIYINDISDGTFPNHHPDPNVEEYMEQLKEAVIHNNADIGISYDGDGDRLGVIDEKGNFILPDKLLIIIARFYASILKNKTVLSDVKCTKALDDELVKLGLTPLTYRAGASYTQAKVYDDNIEIGSEYSGHMYFGDRLFPNSCGIYAGLRMLEILSNSDKSISELLEGINDYVSFPEERILCSDDKKFEIVAKIQEYCISKNYQINTIDGIRVTFEDGWALVRASNTGPNLTTRYEAKTKIRLEEIAKEFNSLISSFGI